MAIWIILGVVLVVFLLLQFSVTAYLRWGEETEVLVGIAGFKIAVYPAPPQQPGKKGKGKAKPPSWRAQLQEMLSRGKDQSFGDFIAEMFELLCVIWPPIKVLLSKMRIQGLRYTLLVGSGDAHQTAMLYAGLSAGFYQVLGALQSNIKVTCDQIDIRPDFTSTRLVQQGQMKLKLRLSSLLWQGIKLLIRLMKIVLQNRKSAPTIKA